MGFQWRCWVNVWGFVYVDGKFGVCDPDFIRFISAGYPDGSSVYSVHRFTLFAWAKGDSGLTIGEWKLIYCLTYSPLLYPLILDRQISVWLGA